MTELSATPSNYEKYRQTHLNYYQKNKEKRKEYNKEYYKTYKTNPITCECGKKMLEKNLRFHIVTNYHTSRAGNKS